MGGEWWPCKGYAGRLGEQLGVSLFVGTGGAFMHVDIDQRVTIA